jgi:surface antigen
LIGGVAGAALGGIVGKTMDQRDCEQAQVALRQAATVPTGQQIAWNSPATGNHGTFTPVSDPATNPNGQTCRQYKRDSIIGGQQTGGDIGIVCRTPDGDYQSVQ